MTLYNWISIVLSIVSLILSLSVAYFAYFRAAKPKILVGSNIILFNSFVNTVSGVMWGGITFVLPITFYNWSPRGGHIYQVRLVVGREQEPQAYFDIEWSNFIKFVDGIKWEDEDVAQPIAISGKESVSKFVRFNWSPKTGEKLKIVNGRYELMLLAWTGKSEKPDIHEKFSFTIEDDILRIFQQTVDNEDSFGIWIPIDDTRRSNRVITRTGMRREYLK